MDDIVILSDSKEELHTLLSDIKVYLKDNLKLEVKSNHQVFPVSVRSIDFVGYKSFHTHILLRKRIKTNFKRMLNKYPNEKSIASYNGWFVHCNSKNLWNKYVN